MENKVMITKEFKSEWEVEEKPWRSDGRDYEAFSNYENAVYLLSNYEVPYKQYFKDNFELWEYIAEWLRYKDERATRNKTEYRKHHYSSLGINNLMQTCMRRSIESGVDSVMLSIDISIENNYQGLLWSDRRARMKLGVFDDE